ncbi:MAG: hypothetical protein ACREAB_00135 [Blastocatellia bacterium]
MRGRVIKIILACCVIAFVAFWLLNPSEMKLWAAALISRFENVVSRSLMAKAAGGVYGTTDRYLSSLQIPNPSEAALKAMADVPPEDAMVFITPNADERSELVYRTVAYLGWPRPIGEARCGNAGEAPKLLFHPRSGRPIKWLFFYRVNPPAELKQTSRMIGPHLVLAPSPELKEWKSYCSQ